MASAPPAPAYAGRAPSTSSPASTGAAHEPSIKHLIVDSSPLLTAPLSSLRGMAQLYYVTPDVVQELRDKRGRNVLDEAQLQLYDASGPSASDDSARGPGAGGLQVKQPTAEAVARITAFARRTGDIAALSLADIRVLALCLTYEIQENGTWRVRDYPGQVLSGPPPSTDAPQNSTGVPAQHSDVTTDNLTKKVDELRVADDETSPAPGAAAAPDAPPQAPADQGDNIAEPVAAALVDADDAGDKDENADDDGLESDAESDSSGGSWITPDNVTQHKIKDMGLFAAPTSSSATKPKTVMKAAVLTGDFAMQNVALQMGLNVFGSGGKRVREVRTWVLRCHACFKLCKDPEKRFCPSCGGPTLIRTSITYVPATPENPQGYVLHLKKNFQYKLRGSVYSLPTPKMGKAGGSNVAAPVLREDQKEWQKGVRTAENRKMKEERALIKSVMDEKNKKGGTAGSTPDGLLGFTDLDWQPAMLMGEKGRRRGGRNGMGGDVPLDKSGMPMIGVGRRNPNEVRKKKK
ncbi:20S-pre-rRNA D-site endonuclease nob1 [Microbotryomycetes sp. JL201]|nr:20S-pre-rRNA D-site endonuclease nob1 [Microbotryomycetes sp. JL201]